MASSEGAQATTTTAASAAETAKHTRQQGGRKRPASVPTPSQAVENIRFECLMNARYHSAREAFLDAVHRWLMLAVIVFGAGAVLALLPDGIFWPSIFSAAAAVTGALDLTFDLSNRARAHALMKRRYFELLADLTEGSKTIEEAEACQHRYNADEEPAYHALLAASWNAAQEMLYGDRADAYDIPRCDQFRQNLCRFEGKKYKLKPRSV